MTLLLSVVYYSVERRNRQGGRVRRPAAAPGVAALSYRPNVILLDLGTPVLGSLDVARKLRRHREIAAVRLVGLISCRVGPTTSARLERRRPQSSPDQANVCSDAGRTLLDGSWRSRQRDRPLGVVRELVPRPSVRYHLERRAKATKPEYRGRYRAREVRRLPRRELWRQLHTGFPALRNNGQADGATGTTRATSPFPGVSDAALPDDHAQDCDCDRFPLVPNAEAQEACSVDLRGVARVHLQSSGSHQILGPPSCSPLEAASVVERLRLAP